MRLPAQSRGSQWHLVLSGCDLLVAGVACVLSVVCAARCHCCSVAQSCPTPRDPMDCSTPGLPVRQQLPELAETHVHSVSGAIQPTSTVAPFSSHLQSLPASGSFPMSHFFASGGQRTGASASVLPVNMQD